ncbi:MAG: CoA transferase [Dehalococcoidia bacterium]|nr:CoA transferase [Dehalococcoidia bacterium]MCB9485848.1 CoA transferase [Thermoflexaceae bacterium]
MANRPLDGIRILDISTGPVGGMATMVLGDFGADITKVERPGGDRFRALANSPMWLRGKQSVELDLTTEAGRIRLRELADGSDVVLVTGKEEECARLGADSATLRTGHPELIYCRITAFGSKGPYRDYPGYEGIVAAKSGRMRSFEGIADREGPGYAAVRVGMHSTSQSAVTAILGALHERDASGEGQVVETSMLQGMQPYDLLALLRSQLLKRYPEKYALDPLASAALRSPTLNYHPLQAGDGRWMQMGNLLQHLFDNYLGAADLADIYADPRYEGPPALWSEEAREELRDRMFLRMREKTADEWMQVFTENGGVAATIYRPTQDALDDPDLILNGMVKEHTHPELGVVRQLGPVANLSVTPGAIGGAAPTAGAHNSSVAAPRNGRNGAGARTSNGKGPLAGVTVVEFATIIAAPLGVSFLGDMGARVIKVEPVGGDPYRGMGMAGIMAARTNQSKESIALDLKSEEGQQIVREIVERSDILIHNYRPGVPERLGIGYADCKAVRPGIVYVSVNGYGPDGPSAHRPSTHPIPGAALGGALMQVGAGRPPLDFQDLQKTRRTAEQLFRSNEANPDPNTSVIVATAAMLGLTAARRFGVGQQVFVDMMATNAYANADDFIQYAGKAPRAEPDGDLMGLSATYRLYEAAEGWVFLAVPEDREFRAFCAAAGADLADDARFATKALRAANDAALSEALAAVMRTRGADAWEAALAPNGIGCVRADGPTPGDFWLDDPHVRENGFIVPVQHPRYGDSYRWGTQALFERTPLHPGAGSLAGDHTDEILAELGYGGDDISRLRREGIAWSEAVGALE